MGRFTEPLAAMESRFKTLVEDVLSIPVQYQNAPQIDKPIDSEWLRFSILTGASVLSAFGGGSLKEYEQVGVMSASIFTPTGYGSAIADNISDTIDEAFRGATLSLTAQYVYFDVPSRITIGVSDEWHQVNVDTTYRIKSQVERAS